MKSTIVKQKTSIIELTFAGLIPGKLYNYRYKKGDKPSGVVLCTSEVYSHGDNKRIVELVGEDAGEYWFAGCTECINDANRHTDIVFTPFTDKLELSNE